MSVPLEEDEVYILCTISKQVVPGKVNSPSSFTSYSKRITLPYDYKQFEAYMRNDIPIWIAKKYKPEKIRGKICGRWYDTMNQFQDTTPEPGNKRKRMFACDDLVDFKYTKDAPFSNWSYQINKEQLVHGLGMYVIYQRGRNHFNPKTELISNTIKDRQQDTSANLDQTYTNDLRSIFSGYHGKVVFIYGSIGGEHKRRKKITESLIDPGTCLYIINNTHGTLMADAEGNTEPATCLIPFERFRKIGAAPVGAINVSFSKFSSNLRKDILKRIEYWDESCSIEDIREELMHLPSVTHLFQDLFAKEKIKQMSEENKKNILHLRSFNKDMFNTLTKFKDDLVYNKLFTISSGELMLGECMVPIFRQNGVWTEGDDLLGMFANKRDQFNPDTDTYSLKLSELFEELKLLECEDVMFIDFSCNRLCHFNGTEMTCRQNKTFRRLTKRNVYWGGKSPKHRKYSRHR